ncbi:MAG: antibiotic biosynthesis monooxygenase [Myxococcota bacterium]|jgi:heme-degrading monooxygenase HmoA
MVIAVFRSTLRPDIEEEFIELGDRMLELAEKMPGFISYTVYKTPEGDRCSVIEFETREHLEAWRDLPEHLSAQQRGREHYYKKYSLFVSEPERESHFQI